MSSVAFVRCRDSLRVDVLDVRDSAVRFHSRSDGFAFEAETSAEDIEKLCALRGQEVDAEFETLRLCESPWTILEAKLLRFVVLEEGDPVALWDAWYAASERSWSGMTLGEIMEELRAD